MQGLRPDVPGTSLNSADEQERKEDQRWERWSVVLGVVTTVVVGVSVRSAMVEFTAKACHVTTDDFLVDSARLTVDDG